MKWRNGVDVDVAAVKAGLPAGWGGLLDRLFSDLDALGWRDGTVLQVKEKFGELRFYVDGADELVQQRIDEAAQESATACYECGSPGEIKASAGGWYRPACEDHE